jgi:hypothetical protein
MSTSKVAVTLIKFAKSRENAFRLSGTLNLAKAEACRKVRTVAGFFRDKKEEAQIRAIRQVEHELRLILPHEMSRYKNQRRAILDLIDRSYD